MALFFGVRDSFAHYCVRYWLDDLGVDDPTDSAVRIRIWFALRRAGIPLSIPASSIFLTHETPEREERKAERRARAAAARRSRRSTCSAACRTSRGASSPTSSRTRRSPRARRHRARATRDDGLYMIVEGEAVVRIGKGREQREVARAARRASSSARCR